MNANEDIGGEAADELRALVPDVETLALRLAAVDYLVDEGLATSMFLSLRLPQPLLLEGEAGVGKTEAARSLALALDTPLIRLQCYEGIDVAEALYEWNYPRQLLSIRLADSGGTALGEEQLFGPEYLIRRPLLRALEHPGPRPAVLLIDEIDRADDDFEAFLLELLGEASVTIPEIGTIRATHPPIIVLTSNTDRDELESMLRPELLDRIDEVIVFAPLGSAEIEKIVELQIELLATRVGAQSMQLHLSERARQFLTGERMAQGNGARFVARAIARHVTTPLSDAILRGRLAAGHTARVDYDGSDITVEAA